MSCQPRSIIETSDQRKVTVVKIASLWGATLLIPVFIVLFGKALGVVAGGDADAMFNPAFAVMAILAFLFLLTAALSVTLGAD